jgi:hypothetical protein
MKSGVVGAMPSAELTPSFSLAVSAKAGRVKKAQAVTTRILFMGVSRLLRRGREDEEPTSRELRGCLEGRF